jgi:hypothetical protein
MYPAPALQRNAHIAPSSSGLPKRPETSAFAYEVEAVLVA